MDLKNIFGINACCMLNASDGSNCLNFLSNYLVYPQETWTWDVPHFWIFTGIFYRGEALKYHQFKVKTNLRFLTPSCASFSCALYDFHISKTKLLLFGFSSSFFGSFSTVPSNFFFFSFMEFCSLLFQCIISYVRILIGNFGLWSTSALKIPVVIKIVLILNSLTFNISNQESFKPGLNQHFRGYGKIVDFVVSVLQLSICILSWMLQQSAASVIWYRSAEFMQIMDK